MDTNLNPRLISESEAAQLLSVSEIYLRKSRWNGNPAAPPFVRAGRMIRYSLDDLAQWIDAHRVTPVALDILARR